MPARSPPICARAGAAIACRKSLAPKSPLRSTAAARSISTPCRRHAPLRASGRRRRRASRRRRRRRCERDRLGVVAPARGVEAAVRLLEVIARRGRDARARDILAARVLLRSCASPTILVSARPAQAGPSPGSRLRGNERAIADRPASRCATDRWRAASGLPSAMPMRLSLDDWSTPLPRPERAACARAGPNALAIGLTAGDRAGLCRRRRAAWLHRARRRSAPARHRLRRRADLRLGAYRRARHRAALAAIAAPQLDGAFTIHISGCAKGCAHAAPAALTVVGTPDGCALIADGSARDAPFAMVAGR